MWFANYKKLLLILGTLVLLVVVINASNSNDDKNELVNVFSNDYDNGYSINDIHVTIEALDDGYDIYVPTGKGYRYGPSIIYYEDGSMDAWFSSPGNNSTEWDYIRYRHSDDGINWGSEKVVLRPSYGTDDHYSTCDPGVFYYDGYYYIGYTSTTNAQGYDNDIYVARSKNPDGPYEKWNGNGWGNNPAPIVDYNLDATYWGAGEISFCIVNDELYCYFSWKDESGFCVKGCRAQLCENWPATLSKSETVIASKYGVDSGEVVYIEKYKKFIILTIEAKFTENSCIGIYESDDGINFIKTDKVKANVQDYAHNIGLSKKGDGSVDMDRPLILGYAYSKNSGDPWGKWSTYFQSMKFVLFVDKIN